MEFLTTPWFIVAIALILAVSIFLVIKFQHKNRKDESLLFDRLRDAEINITIKKPIQTSNLGEDKKSDK